MMNQSAISNKNEVTVSKNCIYKDLWRSKYLGASQSRKPPVSDALQMLSHEGLVTIKPRSGYYVTALTLKQLREILDMHCTLEIAAIERAVLRITPEQLEELRTVYAGYTGEDDVSYERYTEGNRKFHYLIAVASGNIVLAEKVKKIHDHLARFMVV